MRTETSQRRFPLAIALSVLASSLLPGTMVHADQHESSRQAGERLLRFNVSPDGYPPYLIDDDGGQSGIMWDVVTLIAGRLDYQVVAEKVPRKRVDQMLLDGYIDATTRAKEWTDQPEDFAFTEPVVNIEEVLFVPTSSDLDFQAPEDLFSTTLVTHLGYHYPRLEPYFESGQITRFDVARDRDMFRYVLHGPDLDAAVADRLVGKWILLNDGMQGDFRVLPETLSQYGFRIMFRKDWKDFASSFDRELQAMRENGELDRILSNYR